MVNYLPEGNVVVNIDFSIKEGKEQEFLNLAYYLIDHSVTEKGNISYRVFKEKREERSYAIIEHWKNQEALNQHLDLPHTKYYNDNVDKFLTKKPNRVELTRDNDSIQ